MSEQDSPFGKARRNESQPASANDPFAIRLDPDAPPGEISFLIPKRTPAAAPRKADSSLQGGEGHLPPVLVPACEQVIDFIFGLDEPAPTGLGRLMKKNRGSERS